MLEALQNPAGHTTQANLVDLQAAKTAAKEKERKRRQAFDMTRLRIRNKQGVMQGVETAHSTDIGDSRSTVLLGAVGIGVCTLAGFLHSKNIF